MNVFDQMKKGAVVCLLVLAANLSSSGAQEQTAVRTSGLRRPSIIFILADGLGYGDLGCYGQDRIKTPNIDKLAQEGMRFTSCYAGSAYGAPSRAALMTGKHSGHGRIRGIGTVSLEPGDVTISEALKKVGYVTAALGNWGLGEEGTSGVPGKKGFDEWVGYLDQAQADDYYPQYLYRTGEGHDQRITVYQNIGGKKGRYSDDLFTTAALNFMRIKVPDRFNHYRPFFLYLPYTLPRNGMEVPSDAPYTDEPWPQAEKNKAAMITRLDEYVGILMAKLQELKEDKNTIIIFASANGPRMEGRADPRFFRSTGPLRGTKRDLYEGGIRVPMIVWWPGRVKAGSTSDLPCAFWDFMPSLAEVGRATSPPDIDGISMVPTWTGQAQTNRHEFLYWEFHEGGFCQAVRTGDWKAVRFGASGPLELYNLKSDIGEKHNVASENPEVIAKIEEYLKTARTPDEHWPIKTAAQSPEKQHEL